MNNKKFRAIGAIVLVAVWLTMTAFVWFTPDKERSDSERRQLEQLPEFTMEAFLDGSYKTALETYLKDQFPLRDNFRQLKGILDVYLLRQKTDANGMFYMNGHLSQHNMSFDSESFQKRLEILNSIYSSFIDGKNANIYVSVIPDKNYYLSQETSFPTMDYQTIFSAMAEQAQSWGGKYIDVTGALGLDNFYTTDTHWKQETLIPIAQLLCQAMGGNGPKAEDFTAEKIDMDFYGVWYGKAGLPVAADTLYILRNEMLDNAIVKADMVDAKMYDKEQLSSSDPYNIYLSGAKKGYVTIENPSVQNGKKLVVFRDSFGSSISPLFLQDYESVTLVDLRVMSRMGLRLVDFEDADVLFMFSALVLNNSSEMFL